MNIEKPLFWGLMVMSFLTDILSLSSIYRDVYDKLKRLWRGFKNLPVPLMTAKEYVAYFHYQIDEFFLSIFLKFALSACLPLFALMNSAIEWPWADPGSCSILCQIETISEASTDNNLYCSYLILCAQQLLSGVISFSIWRWKRRYRIDREKDEGDKMLLKHDLLLMPSDVWNKHTFFICVSIAYSVLRARDWMDHLPSAT
jgi:hypothetical protein